MFLSIISCSHDIQHFVPCSLFSEQACVFFFCPSLVRSLSLYSFEALLKQSRTGQILTAWRTLQYTLLALPGVQHLNEKLRGTGATIQAPLLQKTRQVGMFKANER